MEALLASVKILRSFRWLALLSTYINRDMRAPRAGTTVVRKTFPIFRPFYAFSAPKNAAGPLPLQDAVEPCREGVVCRPEISHSTLLGAFTVLG
jgi:hypothetical protein